MKTLSACMLIGLLASDEVSASVPGNIIPNGDFATSLDGWTCGSECHWDSSASAENDNTGGVVFPNSRNQANSLTSACFPVSPGFTYTVGFSVNDSVGLIGDSFLLVCSVFSDANCSQGAAPPSVVPLDYQDSGWQSAQDTLSTANGTYANCSVSGGGNGNTLAYDDIFMTPPNEIFADGFDH